MDDALRVIFEDQHLLALDKPAELLVHQNEYERGGSTCLDILQRSYRQRFFTVHRLDRKTSGLLVFARSAETAGALSRSFRSLAVEKRYIAAVHGRPGASAGEITQPLRRRQGHTGETDALTRYRVLGSGMLELPMLSEDDAVVSLLELELITGRQHQARRHARAVGTPIIGDRRYGHRRFNHVIEDHLGTRTLFLHSARLRFIHPVTKIPLDLVSRLPDGWGPLIRQASLSVPAGYRAASENAR